MGSGQDFISLNYIFEAIKSVFLKNEQKRKTDLQLPFSLIDVDTIKKKLKIESAHISETLIWFNQYAITSAVLRGWAATHLPHNYVK